MTRVTVHPVAGVEDSSGDERHAHRLEVRRAGDVDVDLHAFAGGGHVAGESETAPAARGERQRPDEAGRFDTGQPSNFRADLLEIRSDGCGFQFVWRNLCRGHHDVAGAIPEIRAPGVGETPGEETGRDDEHARQGHLDDDHGIADARAGASGLRSARLAAKTGDDVRAPRLERGNEPEQHATGERDREREGKHPLVHPRVEHLRLFGREERGERTDRPEREQHAQCAAADRNDHAFGQELPHEMDPIRAERQPHGQLWPPRRRAGEQQAGHVRARDEQHQCGRRQDDAAQEADFPPRVGIEARVAHHHNRSWRRRCRQCAQVGVGVHLCELGREHLQLCLSVVERRAVFQPCHHADPPVAAFIGKIRRRDERDPHVHPPPEVETRKAGSRHAHDAVVVAVNSDEPAENGRIRFERSTPEVVPNHGDARRVGHEIARIEQPADRRLNADDGEVVGGHTAGARALARVAHLDGCDAAVLKRRELSERPDRGSNRQIVRIGRIAVRGAAVVAREDLGQPGRRDNALGGPKQQGIDEAEDRCVGAGADGQRDQEYSRQAR